MKRTGFTLVEILVAATVLGLGVLGISTLFAGAARQQQIASEQTESARVARNIESLLSDRFERFGGAALDEDPALSTPYFAPGQWHPVPASPIGGVVSALQGTLALDLADNGNATDQNAFGVARAEDTVLYRAPWTDPADVPVSVWGNPAGGMGAEFAPSSPMSVTQISSAVAAGAIFRPSPNGRLQPGFRIEVTYAAEVLAGGGGAIPGPNPALFELVDAPASTNVEFVYNNWNDVDNLQANPELWPSDPDPPGMQDISPGRQDDRNIDLILPAERDGMNRVDAPGSVGPTADSWVRIRVQRPGTNDAPIAELVGANIPIPDNTGDGGRWMVREIRLVGAKYREDRMLALDERLSTTTDDAFPGGRRPARGVSLLYRTTLDGRDQLMTVAYTLEPLGRVAFDPATERAFVPPESFDRLYSSTQDPAAYGLFSQVELELGYDVNLARYTLTSTDPVDDWAVEKDQQVIVCSVNDPVSPVTADRTTLTNNPDPGADAAVRVLFTRRDSTDRFQGVLEDSPRISPPRGGGRSILPRTDGTATQRVHVWAMRPLITSDPGADQSVEWRVRPTGAEVITLGVDR